MNYSILGRLLGKLMILEGVLMIAPLAITYIYKEPLINKLAFLLPIIGVTFIGGLLQIPKCKRNTLYQREGFILVALAWIVMTLFGALPFVINGDIPHYADACFEIMSGFTTTGSSIIQDISVLSHSTLFWRSFSHWIGGMGILVFILIFIPESAEGYSLHLLRAESPGPQVGKLVSKMKVTTRILYLIYLGLTLLEVMILMLDKPISGYENDKLFISLLTTFGCAGTGGFGVIPGSIELFNPFSQYVIAIFLILFGCNFSLYYLLLIGKLKEVWKSEELKTYLGLIFVSVLFIFISLTGKTESFPQTYTGEEAFRHSLFQVVSLMTTTGYTSTDYNVWPTLGKSVLIVLMFTGAMAGSTAGGIKISRVILAVKGIHVNVRKMIEPRYVPTTKFEGKKMEQKVLSDVLVFITLYFFILIFVVFLLSFDPINGQTIQVMSDAGTYSVKHDFFSNFSASLACISNIGPAFEAVGPYASFGEYSIFSKIVLTFTMLLGRLEILPVLILFSKRTWER